VNLELEDYRPSPDLLEGRVILVTGAGDGLGRAAALGFAAYGAQVALLGRTEAKLEAVYDAIVEADGPRPAIVPLDLERAGPADFASLAGLLESELGGLDGVLHAAATLGTLTPLELFEPEVWQQVLRVNLTAPFLLTRACLPLLRRSEDASVLFLSCDAGRRGRAYWGAFAVSKFGLEGLMQVLADEAEVSTSLRVNSLNPGPMRTRQRTRAFPGEDPNVNPIPAQVVPALLYLMGPEGRQIRGQTLDLTLASDRATITAARPS
jgi:NAD(P)-dependent dehydrogenase (short-subunit alcohol dehydrogenase family)